MNLARNNCFRSFVIVFRGEWYITANYDATKDALRQIVDMPNRKLDLAIRFCLQNHGRLSGRKRSQHFNFLSDDEVERIEQAVEATWGKGPSARYV